jgi:hypothetical protein
MKMDNKEVVEVVEEKKEVVAEVAEDITEETIKANEEAIKELEKCSGKQFDSEIVECCKTKCLTRI